LVTLLRGHSSSQYRSDFGHDAVIRAGEYLSCAALGTASGSVRITHLPYIASGGLARPRHGPYVVHGSVFRIGASVVCKSAVSGSLTGGERCSKGGGN
jgi:hypothetical protein